MKKKGKEVRLRFFRGSGKRRGREKARELLWGGWLWKLWEESKRLKYGRKIVIKKGRMSS